ncbi:MAG TPA: phosphoribosylamine--glycine ligase [bacterium]
MKIAVVGSGGREHALLWRLARDAGTRELYALPGNGGTEGLARSIPVDTNDTAALRSALRSIAPDLAVIGPEVPLAAGIADQLLIDGIPCFGPVAAAARIEASKAFSKLLMRKHGIPTADFEIFEDYAKLESFVHSQPEGNCWVVKADGLAAGKGAYVCTSLKETLQTAHDLLVEKKLGGAGVTVVLERKLAGREVSALYLCDGKDYIALPPAQDYKRAEDGDRGPNTGGMGTFCPAAHLTPAMQQDVERTIIEPTLRALAEDAAPYRGVLYAGLMLTADGPQVIEFNCRFGDPETQVILPVLKGDFAKTLLACAEGKLSVAGAHSLATSGAAVCVVLAAEGYPEHYRKSIPLRDAADTDHAVTFHAGTVRKDGALLSSGGRVLNAVGLGATMADARRNAYEFAEQLRVPGLRFRSDIAAGV